MDGVPHGKSQPKLLHGGGAGSSGLEAWLADWQRGIEEFNERRYWHSHEHWEKGWNRLPSPDREHLQALIQAASVFHLIEKGRLRPARSLARLALQKWDKIRALGGLSPAHPRVEIPGVEKLLSELLERDDEGLTDLSKAHQLRAVLTWP